MQENLKSRVNVLVSVYDAKSGTLISTQQTHNLVVNSGLNLLRDALDTGTISPLTRIGFGASATPVTPTNTSLFDEIFRTNITAKIPGHKTLTCQYFLDETTANGQTLKEVGLFTTDGTLYARVLLNTPIPKTELIVATFSWTLDWGSV
jgi:hypothetical protein